MQSSTLNDIFVFESNNSSELSLYCDMFGPCHCAGGAPHWSVHQDLGMMKQYSLQGGLKQWSKFRKIVKNRTADSVKNRCVRILQYLSCQPRYNKFNQLHRVKLFIDRVEQLMFIHKQQCKQKIRYLRSQISRKLNIIQELKNMQEQVRNQSLQFDDTVNKLNRCYRTRPQYQVHEQIQQKKQIQDKMINLNVPVQEKNISVTTSFPYHAHQNPNNQRYNPQQDSDQQQPNQQQAQLQAQPLVQQKKNTKRRQKYNKNYQFEDEVFKKLRSQAQHDRFLEFEPYNHEGYDEPQYQYDVNGINGHNQRQQDQMELSQMEDVSVRPINEKTDNDGMEQYWVQQSQGKQYSQINNEYNYKYDRLNEYKYQLPEHRKQHSKINLPPIPKQTIHVPSYAYNHRNYNPPAKDPRLSHDSYQSYLQNMMQKPTNRFDMSGSRNLYGQQSLQESEYANDAFSYALKSQSLQSQNENISNQQHQISYAQPLPHFIAPPPYKKKNPTLTSKSLKNAPTYSQFIRKYNQLHKRGQENEIYMLSWEQIKGN